MKIRVKEIKKRMIIDDGGAKVIVAEVWPDQGPGLGIMVKGLRVLDGSSWQRRFYSPDTWVDHIGGAT